MLGQTSALACMFHLFLDIINKCMKAVDALSCYFDPSMYSTSGNKVPWLETRRFTLSWGFTSSGVPQGCVFAPRIIFLGKIRQQTEQFLNIVWFLGNHMESKLFTRPSTEPITKILEYFEIIETIRVRVINIRGTKCFVTEPTLKKASSFTYISILKDKQRWLLYWWNSVLFYLV